MPERRPPAAELLEVVREFLERDVLPALSGDRWFQCRVAVNVLGILRRELELGPAFDLEERRRLEELLGETGPLDELNRRLARGIRDGSIDPERPDLLDHLLRATADALRINNPKWLDPPT